MTDAYALPHTEASPPPPIMVAETWSTKEIIADMKADLVEHLNKQDLQLADISRKVDSKADRVDVVAVEAKLAEHVATDQRRLAALEDHRLAVEAAKRFRNKLWAVIGSVSGIAAIIVGALIGAHVH